MRIPSTSTLLAAAVLAAGPLAVSASKLLVVTDSKEVKTDDFSQFWKSLQARGHELTFRDARNPSPPAVELLTRYEAKQYDGLVLFAPGIKALPGDLSPQSIFSFITTVSPEDVPGNVLVALSPNLGEAYRDFAREFSIEFDERDTTLYDPSSTSVSGDQYTVDVPTSYTFSPSQDLKGHSNIISASTKGSSLPIKYSGVVHQSIDIPLLMPLLRAPGTAFPIEIKSSGEVAPVEGGPLVTGESAKLVSGFQTRVNSRVVWSGSLDLFSDKLWTAESSNEAFVGDVTKWLFGEKGVLKVVQSKHFPTKDPSQGMKEQYRIGEEMTYEIELSIYENGRWTAPSHLDDIQLEVTMLDPHLRIPLIQSKAAHHRSSTSRTYVANMKLPDRHGVFTLLTDYRRQGLSWIEDRKQISITPLRHDEYPRFIRGAYPYYVTAGSMLAAWILFVSLWLSIKEDKSDKKKGTGVKLQ